MKKLLLIVLAASVATSHLRAAAGSVSSAALAEKSCLFEALGASQRPSASTLLDKRMPPRFGAVASRSLTGRLSNGARERFLQQERKVSIAKLRDLELLDKYGHFSFKSVADVERAESLIKELPRIFSLNLGEHALARFATSPLMKVITPSLEELNLSYCGLREVPAWIGGIPGLKKLDLRGNTCITIPRNFVFPVGLEELSLGWCGLREVPAGVAAIAGLKKLFLGGNDGINIPAGFIFPAELEELNLALCELCEVPAGVADIAGLKTLKLGSNPGITISRGFIPMGLEELDLNRCGLREVPAEVAALPGLKKLYLWNNQGITIPRNFVFPVGLEELDLSGCGLSEVSAGVAHSAGLKKLNLSGNEGITVPGWLQARVDAGEIKVRRPS